MEAESTLAADALPRSLATVEAQHHLPLAKPFKVYVCATQESFNEYMGAPTGATARGVKVGNSIFLSPETFRSWRGDTHQGVLTHELSHLHIYQRLGHVRSLRQIPAWFSEGVAVMVSGAGGDGVTAEEAREAIRFGEDFVPDDKGGRLRPKRAADYGMNTYMFYRQSELFVTYIRDRDPGAFESFLVDLQIGGWNSFGRLFENSFGTDVVSMWGEFKNDVKVSGNKEEGAVS